MQRAVERELGHRIPFACCPIYSLAATCARAVAARCTAEKCISQRFGNLWRTDNGGTDIPDKATRYALLSSCSPFPPCHPPIPMYLSRFPSHRTLIISPLCLGKRVAQCARTSQFLATLPARYRDSRGEFTGFPLGLGRSSQMNRVRDECVA